MNVRVRTYVIFALGILQLGLHGLLAHAADLTPDVRDLGEKLAARRSSFAAGTLVYDVYSFLLSPDEYAKLKARIGALKGPADLHELQVDLKKGSPKVRQAFSGTLYYKDTKWRSVHLRGPLDNTAALLQAHDPTATVRLVEREDAASDGDHVSVLLDGKTLHLKPERAASEYPQLMSFDMALGPWDQMLEKGAAPAQTIQASKTADGLVALEFGAPEGIAGSHATYLFDPAAAYVSKHVLGINTDGTLGVEVTTALCTTPSDKQLPRPMVSLEAKRYDDNHYTVDLRAVSSWSDDVEPRQLEVPLPRTYALIDERFGEAPKVVIMEDGRPVIDRSTDTPTTSRSSITQKAQSVSEAPQNGQGGRSKMPTSIITIAASLALVLFGVIVLLIYRKAGA